MTDAELRTAIAAALGWGGITRNGSGIPPGYERKEFIPNWTGSLVRSYLLRRWFNRRLA